MFVIVTNTYHGPSSRIFVFALLSPIVHWVISVLIAANGVVAAADGKRNGGGLEIQEDGHE